MRCASPSSAWRVPVPARRDYRVAVEVERFERGPDDSVVLEARWILTDREGELLVERASLREPSQDGSYPATVAAMSRSVSALGRRIAEVIRQREASSGASMRGLHDQRCPWSPAAPPGHHPRQ